MRKVECLDSVVIFKNVGGVVKVAGIGVRRKGMRHMKSTKADLYTQCHLQHRHKVNTVSWIPAKFAKIGAILKLKNDGVWEDGWVVVGVGATSDNPPDAHNAVKEHRKNTGDSLPK